MPDSGSCRPAVEERRVEDALRARMRQTLNPALLAETAIEALSVAPVSGGEVEGRGVERASGAVEGRSTESPSVGATRALSAAEGDRIHGYVPLLERPGYNADPTDWVRYALTTEAELVRVRAVAQRLAEAAAAIEERHGDHYPMGSWTRPGHDVIAGEWEALRAAVAAWEEMGEQDG